MKFLQASFMCLAVVLLPSCSLLDKTISVFDDDGNEVETTVGDMIADNADQAESTVAGALSGIHPLAGMAGGAAAAALFGAARRKKKEAE